MPVQALPRRYPRRSLSALIQILFARAALRRSRARLSLLDDHLLSDIGISREEAQREAAAGWDAPAHWRR